MSLLSEFFSSVWIISALGLEACFLPERATGCCDCPCCAGFCWLFCDCDDGSDDGCCLNWNFFFCSVMLSSEVSEDDDDDDDSGVDDDDEEEEKEEDEEDESPLGHSFDLNVDCCCCCCFFCCVGTLNFKLFSFANFTVYTALIDSIFDFSMILNENIASESSPYEMFEGISRRMIIIFPGSVHPKISFS